MGWLESTVRSKRPCFGEGDFCFLELFGLSHEHIVDTCAMRLTLLMMDSPFLWFRGGLFNSPILCFRVLWGQILWRMVHNVVVWIWPQGILLGVCNIGLPTTVAMLLTTACQPFLFKIRQRLLWCHRGIRVHGYLRWNRMKWLMRLLNLLVRVLGLRFRWLCKPLWTGLFGRMGPRALSTV